MPTKNGGVPAQPEGEPEVHSILATTKERVAEILAATDRAASEIVDAANSEAEKVVADAHKQATEVVNAKIERLSGLIENVLAKAGTLDSEFEQLRGLIEQSNDSLADELGVQAHERPLGAADSSAVETAPTPQGRPGGGDDERAEAVKLLAIQMLATGHSSERARERLRTEFQVEDPEAVLAEIGAAPSEG